MAGFLCFQVGRIPGNLGRPLSGLPINNRCLPPFLVNAHMGIYRSLFPFFLSLFKDSGRKLARFMIERGESVSAYEYVVLIGMIYLSNIILGSVSAHMGIY